MQARRRTVLKLLGLFAGASAAGVGATRACRPAPAAGDLSAWTGFDQNDIAFLDDLAETVIPATSTPGARAAAAGAFMAAAITECLPDAERALAIDGMRRIDTDCRRRYGRGFREASDEERLALVRAIDRDRRIHEYWQEGWSRGRNLVGRLFGFEGRAAPRRPHYFTVLKELVILGYFTSEAGATGALRHLPIPGDYDGHLPYSKGDGAWSM